eukprot:5251770-Amphidinium_carterae.1
MALACQTGKARKHLMNGMTRGRAIGLMRMCTGMAQSGSSQTVLVQITQSFGRHPTLVQVHAFPPTRVGEARASSKLSARTWIWPMWK